MKKIILAVLIIWGFVSFLICVSEDESNFVSCLLWKLAGLLSFGACILTGAWLDKKGYLPKL